MTAREFYQSAEDERLDKEQLQRLFTALDPVEKAFRRKDHAWTIYGKHGRIVTWGDKAHASWAIYACPPSTIDPEGSPRAWGMAKQKLAFLQVTQDGEFDGVFKLVRLPTDDEAALIREVLGIRRRPNVSEQSLQNLREPLAQGQFATVGAFF